MLLILMLFFSYAALNDSIDYTISPNAALCFKYLWTG
jgi:hypothetical protein